MIEQMAFELKIDDECNMGLVPGRGKGPRVCQVLQRPFDGAHQHLSWPVQRDLACEALLKWSKSDDQIGKDFSLVRAVDVRTVAPGNEQGVVRNIRYDLEKIVSTVSERCLLFMTRHRKSP